MTVLVLKSILTFRSLLKIIFYLFLALLDGSLLLGTHTVAMSRDYSLAVLCGFLNVVASPVAEHGL